MQFVVSTLIKLLRCKEESKMYVIDDICYAGEKDADVRIKDAKVLRGGMLLVTFSSGEQRLFDTTQLTGSAFAPLKDEKILQEFNIFHGVLTWMNGEIDIAPETVYEDSYPYTSEENMLEVPLRDITFWNYFRNKMYIEPGEYVVEVGSSSADLPCTETFSIKGEWDAPLSNVYVQADKYCYLPGEKSHLKIVATLEDTTRLQLDESNLKITSSNEEIAAADAVGNIVAKAPGTAAICVEVTYKGKTVKRIVPAAVKE